MLGLFLWKIKKGITLTNAFQKTLKESNRKPNKIWVDKRSEFYISSVKKLLKDAIDIEMILKFIRYITKEILLLLKGLLELQRLAVTSTWLQYQKMCISIN